jgi:hypothetical protein
MTKNTPPPQAPQNNTVPSSVLSIHIYSFFTMKNPSKTTVELAKDTADPKAKQQAKQQPWSLTKTMIVVIGACCVVSAFVNLLHAHGMDSTHDDTAMHQAMKEFMEGPPDMIKRKKSEGPPQSAVKVEAVAVDVHQEEEEEPPERGGHHPAHDMEEDSDSEDHKAITSDVSSSPRAAHLSCQKHGGPEDEFAQEMVYWQDIPSDARYVSPFHSKKGQQKRYMVRSVATHLLFMRLVCTLTFFSYSRLSTHFVSYVMVRPLSQMAADGTTFEWPWKLY